ncbi:MAG: hypothetical protein GY755_06405 [Chloroflexi bacterium]|nr:hypothetical protein [Chloroflexota bacterium]
MVLRRRGLVVVRLLRQKCILLANSSVFRIPTVNDVEESKTGDHFIVTRSDY